VRVPKRERGKTRVGDESAVSGLAQVKAKEIIIAYKKSHGPAATDLTKDSPPVVEKKSELRLISRTELLSVPGLGGLLLRNRISYVPSDRSI
jgi:hypothetical protein